MPRPIKTVTSTVTVRLSADLVNALRALKRRDGIGTSEAIRRAIVLFLQAKGIKGERS